MCLGAGFTDERAMLVPCYGNALALRAERLNHSLTSTTEKQVRLEIRRGLYEASDDETGLFYGAGGPSMGVGWGRSGLEEYNSRIQ